MNKRISFSVVLLGILVLSGCVNMGTMKKPLQESMLKRADGSWVGHAAFRTSIDSSTTFITIYEDDGKGNLVAIKESDPKVTPTVAGQTIQGATTALFGSAPIGAGIATGQLAAASGAKGVARIHAEASKDAAPSTIFNLVPIANPTSISGSTSNAVNDIGVGFGAGLISDWAK